MMNGKFLALMLAMCGALSGCHSEANAPKPKPAIYPGSVFVGQGSPSNGTIKIYLAGDVQVPGPYFLPRNSTLLDLLMRIGTIGPSQDGRPLDITLKWEEGSFVRSEKYRFQNLSKDELSKIKLVDGMVGYVPTRVL